ncbi:YdcF family protein [Vagococcus vulneris]
MLQMIFLILIPFFLFAYWIYYRPTSLFSGLFFILLITSVYAMIVFQIFKRSHTFAYALLIPALVIIMIFTFFGIFSIVLMLFWNEKVMLKREGFSIANLLPMAVSLSLIAFQVYVNMYAYHSESQLIKSTASFFSIMYAYVIFMFFLYSVTSILYNVYPIRRPVDYIIILGAGLIDGERVTPLLASRIQAGLSLYHKQVAQINHHPTIILSGGQGENEKISEAQAMMNYLTEKNELLKTVYLEEKSKNTQQNIEYSKLIISKNDNIKNVNELCIVLASNNYHVLRAGKLAAEQGLVARAVGAKTRLYYLPTAFIREYIGYLYMNKKRTIVFTVLAFIFTVALSLIDLFFN